MARIVKVDVTPPEKKVYTYKVQLDAEEFSAVKDALGRMPTITPAGVLYNDFKEIA